MVAPTPPIMSSMLSQPISVNSFIAVQSAKLTVSNAGASGSQSITFTDLPGTGRISAKITNSGTKGCYLASGAGSATAVVSSGTPTPTTGDGAVATCDYIGAGTVHTLSFIKGTNTFAAICSGTDTTTLEISTGYGQ